MDTALVKRSWDLYLKNIGIALGATIVAGIIGGISFGILAGPMIAGLLALLLNLVRGQKAEFNQIFSKFDKFLPTFLVVLIIGIATILLAFAQNIPLIGGLIFQTITMLLGAVAVLAIAGVVEKNLDFIPALQFGVGYLAGRPALLLLFGGYGLAMGLLNLIFSFSWVLLGLFGTLIGLFTLFISPMFGLTLMISYNEDGAAESKMDMKLLQIVGIGLAAVVVIGLVFMIVRGPVRQVGGFFGGRSRSGIERDLGGSFTLSGKDSEGNKVSLGLGSSIPKSFPKDVPIIKGAEVFTSAENKGEGTVTISATVDKKASTVRDYYLKELQRRGWEINQEILGILGNVTAVKNDRQVVVVVLGADEDETASLSITVGPVTN